VGFVAVYEELLTFSTVFPHVVLFIIVLCVMIVGSCYFALIFSDFLILKVEEM
jgi:TM2 domain-containing membrane protein YozV